jgi:HPt (histidine-containing phosphotransfer) domain-containing protein
VNWDALQRHYRGRQDFIGRLVTLSLESNEGMAERLRGLVEAGDLAKIAKLAHTLKGFAGSMSAPEVERLAIRTLGAARLEDGAAIGHAIDLADALDRLMDALRQARERRSSAQ